MPESTIHKMGVTALCNQHPELETCGFRRQLRAAVNATEPYNDIEWGKTISFLPDAFVLDTEEQVATIYEVEASNPINDTKLYRLADAWFVLDYYDWHLRAMICDRWGNVQSEAPLMNAWYSFLQQEVSTRKGLTSG